VVFDGKNPLGLQGKNQSSLNEEKKY